MKIKLILITIIIAAVTIVAFSGAFVSAVAKEFTANRQQVQMLDSPNNTSAEVYRGTVEDFCQKNVFSEYSDVVLRMVCVYSETHTTDVLNASYSYLNTKYEHKNESILIPEYSIEIGITQIKEWAEYTEKKYLLNPIEDDKALLVLLQAYEFQDKGYIDYAIGKGYSPTSAVDYCSSKAFNSEKNLSNIDFYFAAKVDNFTLQDFALPENDGILDEWQKKVVTLALNYNNYSKNGIRTQGGYCLRFTNDIYEAAGISVQRANSAYSEGVYYGVSNDWSSIPVGAQIYCSASQSNGHVGIYIGGGYVVHCSTYKSSDAVLLKNASNPFGYVIKQPLASFITGYKAKCWGFSGAMAEKYPYLPGRFM